MTLVDSFQRKIDYARIAVTDRCNLRCYYCMPAEGTIYEKRKDLLSLDEIYFILEVLGDLGFAKIRFTGGEPFLRPKFMFLIRKVCELGKFHSLHITSNGVFLPKYLPELKELSVLNINLSLDSLDESTFQKITRRNDFQKVIDAFYAMINWGFKVKVNTVAMRGINEADILPISQLAKDHPVDVRFIEEMPFNGTGQSNQRIFKVADIKSILMTAYPDMISLPVKPGSTTMGFQVPGHTGKLGIIAAVTRSFCDTCDRLRVTAKGEIKNCLYDNGVFSLRDYLRQGASQSELAEKIKEIVRLKANQWL